MGNVSYRLKSLVNGKEGTWHVDKVKILPEECLDPRQHPNLRAPFPSPIERGKGEGYDPRDEDDFDDPPPINDQGNSQGSGETNVAMEGGTNHAVAEEGGGNAIPSTPPRGSPIQTQTNTTPQPHSTLPPTPVTPPTTPARYALRSKGSVPTLPRIMRHPIEYGPNVSGGHPGEC